MSKKFTNEFHCCEKVFNQTDFLNHMIAEHGYVKKTPSTRSLVQALDGSGFYSNTYELKIPCGDKIVTAQQVTSGPRGKGDMMSMEEE